MPRSLVCIEDDPEVIELLRLIVARQGFDFIEARGGTKGIELVEETLPDLVLLDLMMPGLDGWEVFDHLKNNPATKEIPIIVVTARAHFDERVAEMRAANAGNLLTKPFIPQQLIEAINHVLHIS